MNRKDQILEMLKEEPKDAFLNYALALELEKEENATEALQVVKSILEEDPSYLGAYLKYAELLLRFERLEEAETACKKGMEVAKEQGDSKAMREIGELLNYIQEMLD